MKSITIRDLRQKWPEAEAALTVENEILITRDGQPVAKLVRFAEPKTKRKRWDPEAHKRWMKKMWGNRVFNGQERLDQDRADRWEKPKA